MIPTVDSVRNNHFVNLYVSLKLLIDLNILITFYYIFLLIYIIKHLLMTGPTGTGKTLNIMNEINANYYNSEFTNL